MTTAEEAYRDCYRICMEQIKVQMDSIKPDTNEPTRYQTIGAVWALMTMATICIDSERQAMDLAKELT